MGEKYNFCNVQAVVCQFVFQSLKMENISIALAPDEILIPFTPFGRHPWPICFGRQLSRLQYPEVFLNVDPQALALLTFSH